MEDNRVASSRRSWIPDLGRSIVDAAMPDQPMDDRAIGIVSAFLARFLDDHAQGRERGLSDYQALFPGFEDLIEAEWEKIRTEFSDRGIDETIVTPYDRAPLPDAPLGRFGPFALEDEIGRGGQGTVYRARHIASGEVVALKCFRPKSSSSATAFRRFQREAASAQLVDHPGLCPVLDAGVLDDVPWITMPLLGGRSLSAIIKEARTATDHESRRRTTDEEVHRNVQIIERVARALHAAHESGIIHRDVKPGNIIITKGDQPVLLDFGFARILDDDSPSVTQSGDLFGTPPYMSPEQIARQSIQIDRRTDIWSLGVCLYESLTLRRPFEGATRNALYQNILLRPPPDPRQYNPDIERELSAILEVALEKDPDRRYATANAFADDLLAFRTKRPISARPPGRLRKAARWARRNPAATVAILFIMIGLVTSTIAVVQWREADRRRGLEEFLDDVTTAEHLLETRDQFWPLRPESAEFLSGWMRDVADVTASLRSRIRTASSVDTANSGFEADALDSLVRRAGSLIEQLEKRGASFPALLEAARSWDAPSKTGTSWADVDEYLETNRAFRDTIFDHREGLVPLGKNPQGLHEFWVKAFGPPPASSRTERAREGCVLVLIPGGSAMIGSLDDDTIPGWIHRSPPHEVRHRRRLDAYLIGKYEISQRAYARVMNDHPSRFQEGYGRYRNIPGISYSTLQPVESITREQAIECARRIDCLLPTEAQWEHAARGGLEGHWAYDNESVKGHENIADRTMYKYLGSQGDLIGAFEDGHILTAPVGSYEDGANHYGLFDTHGNVAEWCRDLWEQYPERVIDDSRPDGLIVFRNDRDEPEHALRVYRGGSFVWGPDRARVSQRTAASSGEKSHAIGFRVARPLTRPD